MANCAPATIRQKKVYRLHRHICTTKHIFVTTLLEFEKAEVNVISSTSAMTDINMDQNISSPRILHNKSILSDLGGKVEKGNQ